MISSDLTRDLINLFKKATHATVSQTIYGLIIQIFLKCFVVILIFMTQSGHNFAYGLTAKLSGHVQNCDPIQSLDGELINSLWNGPLVSQTPTVYIIIKFLSSGTDRSRDLIKYGTCSH